MRIIKYLFTLILLSLFALTVFIATLQREFIVEKTKMINSQKSIVFDYVNELQNLKEWNAFIEGKENILSFSKKTSGLGSICFWGIDKQEILKTINLKKGERLTQNLTLNNTKFEIVTNLKEISNKTKITLTLKGKMDFKSKILDFFNLNSEQEYNIILENSLVNLSKNLDHEFNFYATEIVGLVKKKEEFYLSETFNSPLSKLRKNSNIVFSKIINFCTKNNIDRLGYPFVIFHKTDSINKKSKISICIPIKNPIFTTAGSEILCDTLKPFYAVKTTLRGNLSHTSKAINKTLEHIKNKKLPIDPTFSHLELYFIGKTQINSPSKWVTEIYVPLHPSYNNLSQTKKSLPKQEVVTGNLEEGEIEEKEKLQDEL